MSIPSKATVLVIGGGPAGSYASTVLAREGIDVVQFEALKHPRPHIGESMLPSMRFYLNFIGLVEEFESRNFIVKPGAVFKLAENEPACYADFQIIGKDKATWHVDRAESDKLMWDYAKSQGVSTFEETRVEAIQFENDGDPATSRPISASWTSKSGQSGTIHFDWLIDASGRSGIMSTKYLRNRIFREGLRNVGVYGYWKNVRTVNGDDHPEANATWIEALEDKSGWAWIIALHTGVTSIGVVMHEEASKVKKAQLGGTLQDHYLEQLKLVPGVMDHIGDKGELVGPVRSTVDYSYHATTYSGDHYRMIGDAAAFVDPLFSSGVHVAMTGALSAATTILASMKGQIPEADAQKWHDAKVGICQTRFLLVVLSTYKHMQHTGSRALLSDLDPEQYRAAFDVFRPLYQGDHDATTELSNEELQFMIDYTRNLFTPTTIEQRHAIIGDLKANRPSVLRAPTISSEDLKQVLDSDDSDAKAVFRMLSGTKVLKTENNPDIMFADSVNGYNVNLERGALGLIPVKA